MKLAEELAAFVQMTGAKLALVPSRRTPKRGLRDCQNSWNAVWRG